MSDWRDTLKSFFPREATYLYRLLRDRVDGKAVLGFLRNSQLPMSLADKNYLERFDTIKEDSISGY